MTGRFLRRHAANIALWLAFGAGFVLAAQNNTWSPTTGTVTGLQLTTNYNNAFSAVQSCNSGSSAPANDQTAAAVKGQCWLNTGVTPNVVSMFDGTSWVTQGWLDSVNHFWISNTGGSTGTIGAAATTDLGTVANQVLSVTGSATITSLGTTAITGTIKLLNFAAGSTLTHNATSLILPNGGGNITTAAGDTAVAVALGTGNWRVLNYTRAAGTALSAASSFTANVSYTGIITPTALVSGNNNNWNPAGLSTSETIRIAGTAPSSNITGIAAGTSGQQFHLSNVGTVPIVLTAQDANSTAANQFQMPAPYIIGPDQTVAIRYDTTSAHWRMVTPQRSQPNSIQFKNLKITNDGTAPTTTMDITADELSVQDASGNVVRLTGVSVAPVLTASGANGLDNPASLVPSTITWFSDIVIFNPSTNAVAGLYSVQANCLSASLPAGYTYCARVGWTRTDGAATNRLMRTLQLGNRSHYVQTAGSNTLATPLIIQGASGCSLGGGMPATVTTLVNASLANFVPTTAASATVIGLNGANGNPLGNVVVAPQNIAFYTATNNGPRGTGNVGWPIYFTSGQLFNTLVEIDLEAMILGWCSDNNGGALYAWGWKDNL
jgi:hypothetical protein